MFLRSDHGQEQAGGTATLSFGRGAYVPTVLSPFDKLRTGIAQIDWAPDLGARIGSADWWRGAATCAALITATCFLSPGFDRPILGDVAPAMSGSEWDEARAQSIAPLAWGAATGRHMAANDLVAPLAQQPERPRQDLTTTLGQGDSFARMLERAGVSKTDSAEVTSLVSNAVALDDIKPGTRIDMTLGRRPDRTVARPLEQLAFRAKFDLKLSVSRTGNALSMTRQPIAIDHTPMRIQGLVGSSLYRSARAAGAPARAVEAYIKAIASRISIGGDVRSADTFDIIIEQARAATGEVQLGSLMFAGLDQGRKKVQLVKWGSEGREQWFEANGVGERRGAMGMPVAGRLTSNFGIRIHPILHTARMHKGLDIAAAYGSPIYAAMDGVVALAGRNGGYGNFVKLIHGGGMATGYGHMSRIAVRPGTRVARGQVIGYVGSTGMSTGPHLHYELWKNGVAINPRSVSFTTMAQLSGATLKAFKARVASLMSVRPGGR
ncbi:M23 family metallopeptidase [Sphingomonas sp. So64.6b]|uniref:M23 family metallopeptidase n=1 Tax=Sphingomonas sp. So64.6b TaxID=2997354 RepID=UPI0016025E59|nr:M23 family metallopeptidase [Sphingomonas sp. So64.6b]QNA85818.1 M23 family metallopeptidase [Sphingomonas sp. So64.6b]